MLNFYWSNFPHNGQEKLILFGLCILPLIPALGVACLLIAACQNFHLKFKFSQELSTNNLLLLLTFWLILSCLFAQRSGEAWLGLANFLPFFAVFVLIKNVINQIQQLKIISLMISFASIIIVTLGLGQLYWGWSSPQFLPPLIGWHLVLNGVPAGRMSAVFIHANLLSLYLTTSFILSCGVLLSEYSKKNNFFKSTKKAKKINLNYLELWLILTIVFDLIGLVLTNSRNGWLIAFWAIIAFCFYYQWYRFIQLLTILGIMVSWASFGSFEGQTWLRKIVPDFLWQRLSDEMFNDRPLTTLRITQWRFCWDMTWHRPIFGWGLRNFGWLYKEEFATYLGHPHNLFLMFMAETGIIGLILLMLFVGRVFQQGIIAFNSIKNSDSERIILFSYLICFSAYFIFNLFDVSIFDLRSNTLGWFILICIAGVSEKLRQKPENYAKSLNDDEIIT
jgi:O-antigen ligase